MKKLEALDLTKVEVVDIDSIDYHPRNARHHLTEDLVADSITQHGQYKPLLVQKSTRYVLAGNGTLKVMRDLGYTKVAVLILDVDDDQAIRILLADNATSDGSTYDDLALAELLQGMDGDFIGTGWSESGAADYLQLLEGSLDVDVLADEYGEADEEEWMAVRIPLPPEAYSAWTDHQHENGEGDPTKAMLWLMEQAGVFSGGTG